MILFSDNHLNEYNGGISHISLLLLLLESERSPKDPWTKSKESLTHV